MEEGCVGRLYTNLLLLCLYCMGVVHVYEVSAHMYVSAKSWKSEEDVQCPALSLSILFL